MANCAMDRERSLSGSNGYGRELGVDILAELVGRAARSDCVGWLDLCCGSGRALVEAAQLVAATGSMTEWVPDGRFDLLTSVHGLHYVGDELGALVRAASWLMQDGCSPPTSMPAPYAVPIELRSAVGSPPNCAGRGTPMMPLAAEFRVRAASRSGRPTATSELMIKLVRTTRASLTSTRSTNHSMVGACSDRSCRAGVRTGQRGGLFSPVSDSALMPVTATSPSCCLDHPGRDARGGQRSIAGRTWALVTAGFRS